MITRTRGATVVITILPTTDKTTDPMTGVSITGAVSAPTDDEGFGSPGWADLDVQPLSPTQWRVCDRRRAADDGLSVLGFIEETDIGVFESVEIGQGHGVAFASFSFTCLADATAHFIKAGGLT
jgi:hypothetical protein